MSAAVIRRVLHRRCWRLGAGKGFTCMHSLSMHAHDRGMEQLVAVHEKQQVRQAKVLVNVSTGKGRCVRGQHVRTERHETEDDHHVCSTQLTRQAEREAATKRMWLERQEREAQRHDQLMAERGADTRARMEANKAVSTRQMTSHVPLAPSSSRCPPTRSSLFFHPCGADAPA